MKRKKIFPRTVAELEALPTKQLLARLKGLHQYEQSFALSDRDNNDYDTSGSIEFKETAEWTAAYDHLKRVLARREHIGATQRSK